MIKCTGWWTLFIVSLFIAWWLAGVLMDLTLQVVIVSALVAYSLWPRKTKQ
ncbi:hypothetical protein [Phytobacter diazotrophicus]|uniref:hypothetical protein n=1 Tax=Phytobacter diazotrophicus TaxID=395631 RepID=UPI002FF8D6A6